MTDILLLQCPKCGHINAPSAVNCELCHINLSWAQANPDQWTTERQNQRTEAAALSIGEQESTYVLAGMQSLTGTAAKAPDSAASHMAMLKEIRAWGIWSLVLGVVHILVSGFLSAPWGVLLLIVGLASFFFRTAAMFIIYAVILVWVALSNALSGVGGWIVFALLQLYWAVRVIQQFRRFRQAEVELTKSGAENTGEAPSPVNRSERLFPWAGSLLSCSAVLGVLFLCAASLMLESAAETTTIVQLWAFMVDVTLNLGVLGFAVGLASLLSGYRHKPLAIMGLVAGLLIMILNLALFFLLPPA